VSRRTPYDKGTVSEPKLWVDPSIALEPDESRWGRVEFEGDDGTTIAIARATQAVDARGMLSGQWILELEIWDENMRVEVDYLDGARFVIESSESSVPVEVESPHEGT
jgi:hypothetical protein